MIEKWVYVVYLIFLILFVTMTTVNASGIEFYNYGIQETKVDYIIKDNRIFINLKNNLIQMQTNIKWYDNLMSCEKTRNNAKYKLLFGKKSSSIFLFGNGNKDVITMDYIPQKIKSNYYVQLTKLCEALDLKWKYSNKKGIQKFEIEEGGY